jgi:hypothetical protein
MRTRVLVCIAVRHHHKAVVLRDDRPNERLTHDNRGGTTAHSPKSAARLSTKGARVVAGGGQSCVGRFQPDTACQPDPTSILTRPKQGQQRNERRGPQLTRGRTDIMETNTVDGRIPPHGRPPTLRRPSSACRGCSSKRHGTCLPRWRTNPAIHDATVTACYGPRQPHVKRSYLCCVPS